MKKFSEDRYVFRSDLAAGDIVTMLEKRTLIQGHLIKLSSTDKDFIGRIHDNTFLIFDSSFFPNGIACVLHGEINPDSEIIITTTLHRGFRTLFLIALIAMVGNTIFNILIDVSQWETALVYVFLTPIMAFVLRMFLHGYYVLTRNRALQKIKDVLKVKDA